MKKPKISVVLCTYNRADRVSTCLEALLNQSLDAEDYEIIVVNDGSVDDTAEVLKKYNVKVVTNRPNQGIGQSRSNGVHASKADIIAFTDDDCVPDKDWLKYILRAYADPGVLGVGGKIVPYRTDHWLLKFYQENNPLAHVVFTFNASSGVFYTLKEYIKRSLSLRRLPEREIELHMIVGANMSMRRSTFYLVGGFDPNIRFGGEEEDFWTRLYKLSPDAQLRYAPKALIRHNYDSSFKDAVRRNYSYGIGAARTFLKDKGRLPVLYPFPLLILLSLGLVALNPYFLLIPLFLTLFLYGGWLGVALLRRDPTYIFYAYVQMLLELINSYGFVKGYIKFSVAKSHALRTR